MTWMHEQDRVSCVQLIRPSQVGTKMFDVWGASTHTSCIELM